MNREELYNLHYALTQDARHLMERKNQDYAEGSDPFKNFRGSLQHEVHPAKGILIRIGDKLQRFNSFINRGDLKVSDESLRDSAIDVINYVVLMYGLLTENSNDLKEIDSISKQIDANIKVTQEIYESRKATNGSTWNKEVDVKLGEEDNA